MNNLITLKYQKRQITDFTMFDKRLKVKLAISLSHAFSITKKFRGRGSQTSLFSRFSVNGARGADFRRGGGG